MKEHVFRLPAYPIPIRPQHTTRNHYQCHHAQVIVLHIDLGHCTHYSRIFLKNYTSVTESIILSNSYLLFSKCPTLKPISKLATERSTIYVIEVSLHLIAPHVVNIHNSIRNFLLQKVSHRQTHPRYIRPLENMSSPVASSD